MWNSRSVHSYWLATQKSIYTVCKCNRYNVCKWHGNMILRVAAYFLHCYLIIDIWQPEGHGGAGGRHHHVLWVELGTNLVYWYRVYLEWKSWKIMTWSSNIIVQLYLHWPGHIELHSCGLHWGRRLFVHSLHSRCEFDRPLNHWRKRCEFLDTKIRLIEPDHELWIRGKGGLQGQVLRVKMAREGL